MSPGTGDPIEPYLSVVVATRNDDHGGDPLKRLQALVTSFDAQCRRYRLSAELIVVEWNPPADRPVIRSLLRLPVPAFCAYRFIAVPPEVHQRLQYADVLPLFQMIAKNVGIRRARGRFVLATNIDIILSNELMAHIGTRQLDPGHLYRVDRHDIEPDVPLDATLDEQMAYCRTHQLRVHTRRGSYPVTTSGVAVCLADDIVDGRTVRLGDGWHVREGDATTRFYRWASQKAELLVCPDVISPDAPMVLDIEIQSNPYDVDSWVDVVAVEDERSLARIRVTGQARLAVPLDTPFGAVRRVELRVVDAHPGASRSLPAFECRDTLEYRVLSARLRPPAPAEHATFQYPSAMWTNAFEDSGVRVEPAAEGIVVSTDAMKRSHCVEYGPMRAAVAGLYRFNVTCTIVDGAVSVGVLNEDRTKWISASVNRHGEGGGQRFEIAVDLIAGQRFWILVSNQHPDGDGVSTFTIHRLDGSEDPSILLADPDTANRKDSRRRGWRRRAADCANAAGKTIAALLGRRLTYRVARAAPEFEAVENARRTAEQQLRELAPLRYLGDLEAFLRDRRPRNLHVNSCGDFQLMAREHWDELRGYPEFETFSMNIDGLLSYMADAAGIKEQILAEDIYHLEHEVGSGWSPEGEAILRRRIAERGITWLDASTVYIWAAYMKWLRRPMIFNGSDWGFANDSLVEHEIAAASGSTP